MFYILSFVCLVSCAKNTVVMHIPLPIEDEEVIELIPLDTATVVIDTVSIFNYIAPMVNQDSIDRAEYVQDSIAFRKVTKRVNGGYNGWADRFKLWMRTREILKTK